LYVDDFDRISDVKQHPELKEIFKYPHANWICGHKGNLTSSIQRYCKRAADKLPTFVLYNIPNRDLGSFSKGGAEDDSQYLKFIDNFCQGLGSKEAIIIFEPDALPHAIVHDAALLDKRLVLMNKALKIIADSCINAKVYVDVGHPRWIDANSISKILKRLYNYRGISINVSNFVPDEECIRYGRKIGKPFVIDTSRNGSLEETTEWCNPPGRKIGRPPEMMFKGLLDGYLWVKVPGESDGKCNGGPKAGKFWKEYALELINEKD
jgi:endoglucanase